MHLAHGDGNELHVAREASGWIGRSIEATLAAANSPQPGDAVSMQLG
jgi:hypothetical protein